MALKGIVKIETAFPLGSPTTTGKYKSCSMKTPFICPICGDVWQPQVGYEGKDILHDFPRIGCSLKTCPKCE